MKLPHIVLGVLGAALLAGFVFSIRHVNGPRVVASAVAPNGTEIRVIQKCNWSGEPFTTWVTSHKSDGTSGWHYYDHQDDYWGRGRAILDERRHLISIVRDGAVTATFDYVTDTFTLLRR